MKRIMYHLCTAVMGILVVAGNFLFTRWLFGQTVAFACLVFQFVVGAWIVYELIRAPVYDD